MWQKTILGNVSPDWHKKSIQQSIRWVPKQRRRDGGLWAKGSRFISLEGQRILKSLKPVLSDSTPECWELYSEYNTSFPLALAQALLLQGKLNISFSIFVSTQQEANKILNCEKSNLWNSLTEIIWILQMLSQMIVWLVQTNWQRLLY